MIRCASLADGLIPRQNGLVRQSSLFFQLVEIRDRNQARLGAVVADENNLGSFVLLPGYRICRRSCN
jgi:hypothetical protein